MATRPELEALRRKLNARGKKRAQRPPESTATGKRAAVLIPIFEREDKLHVLYTRRSDQLISHQGQVAFPGGRADPKDPDLLATALREAHEEVGLLPDTVDVLGPLTAASTFASGFTVSPYVGV